MLIGPIGWLPVVLSQVYWPHPFLFSLLSMVAVILQMKFFFLSCKATNICLLIEKDLEETSPVSVIRVLVNFTMKSM